MGRRGKEGKGREGCTMGPGCRMRFYLEGKDGRKELGKGMGGKRIKVGRARRRAWA